MAATHKLSEVRKNENLVESKIYLVLKYIYYWNYFFLDRDKLRFTVHSSYRTAVV